MTTLSDGVTSISFTDDLLWQDEFNWTAVEQSMQRTITGALVVQNGARTAGRPITLAPEDGNSGWIARSTLLQMLAWANVAGQQLTLTYRGASRTVVWRHQDTAIEATPVAFFAEAQPTDWFVATLRFMEV